MFSLEKAKPDLKTASLIHRYTHLILPLVQPSTSYSTQAGAATTVRGNSEEEITTQHNGKQTRNQTKKKNHPSFRNIIKVTHFRLSDLFQSLEKSLKS